jgi:hypothetical protein
LIVLRITAGKVPQDIRIDRAEVVLGSDPTADVTLQHVGLAPRALRMRREDDELAVEFLDSARSLRLRAGDAFEIGEDVGVEIVSLGTDASLLFGGYGDDLATRSSLGPIELADDEPALPRADATRPAASTGPLAPPPQPAPPHPAPVPSRPPAGEAPAAPTPPASALAEEARRVAARHAAARARAAQAQEARAQAEKAREERRKAELKAVKFPDPNFSAELMAQLRRTPFFAISLGVHLLIFLLLMLLDSTNQGDPIAEGPGAITASLDAEADEMGEFVPEVEPEGLPMPEEPLADLPPTFDEPVEEKPRPPTPDDPFRRERTEIEESEAAPEDIGIMPGLRAASARPRKRKPRMPKAELKRAFTKGAAGSSNQLSADFVRAELGRGRKGDAAKLLQELTRDDVLVVDGSFDHIERVLDALEIQYVKKSPFSLTQPRVETFKSYKVVFWNCTESLGPRKIQVVTKELRRFVQDGGYLFTTDWGVANVLAIAFPGYLKTRGNRAHLPEMTLPIRPAESALGHPLLEGVFLPGVEGKWWLENASFDVEAGRRDKVTVLIESPMLKSTFNRSPVVAATFHYGRGRVLHTMGHYYQEAGNLAGTIAAHRLALNFVLMRLDQDRPADRR